MRFGKVILVVFFLAFAFSSAETRAQKSNSQQQISILNNSGSIPFEDGKTIIAEVKLTGLDGDYEQFGGTSEKLIPESDFRKALKEQRAEIDADDTFYGYKISKVVKLLKEWISLNGYIDAEVVALGEKLSGNRMRLIFKVKRGAQARVSEIRFAGNINITGEEFVDDFKQCSGSDWEIFDTRKYDYYSRKCSRNLLFSKGYFEAKVKRVTTQLAAGKRVVTIEVEEGLRYRIGEIKVRGAKVFTEKEILEMGELNTGAVADGRALQDFFDEKLRKVYRDKGYILYNVDIDPKYTKPLAEGLDAAVDILITIDEGRLFKLASIKFSGIEKAAELRKLFSLKDGEIYNQSKIDDGVKKINEMKRFCSVDKDQDVEIRADEESDDIYLVIRVKEID